VAANPFSLEGRVALVTGGNSGIGRALALAFQEAGARVAIGARRAQRNEAVLAELGPQAAAFELDVCDEQSVERAIAGVVERFGRLDILVNNAGGVNRKSVMELERGDWEQVLAINLTGPFLCTKHAARRMKGQGSGKIINIASMLSFQGGIIVPSYTAAKSGVAGITRALANEWAKHHINVNAIAPGYMATDNTAALRADPNRSVSILDRIPAGRWGTPDDLKGVAVFLASPASDYMYGSIVPVDGGWLTR
jgi:2-deoxy-D-gluconate 3-dehydrogenase